MKLEEQNKIVKKELLKLYDMLSNKILEMEKANAPRFEIRKVIGRRSEVQNILEIHYNFHNNPNIPNQLEITCKIGDKY